MTGRDLVGTLTLLAMGLAGGAAIGAVATVVFGIVGVALGVFVSLARIRWSVALPVIVGTSAGTLLGWAITHAFCRPDGCRVGETLGAGLAGIGSLVGVGLVVALAARSFDEYRQAAADRIPPPGAGAPQDQ